MSGTVSPMSAISRQPVEDHFIILVWDRSSICRRSFSHSHMEIRLKIGRRQGSFQHFGLGQVGAVSDHFLIWNPGLNLRTLPTLCEWIHCSVYYGVSSQACQDSWEACCSWCHRSQLLLILISCSCTLVYEWCFILACMLTYVVTFSNHWCLAIRRNCKIIIFTEINELKSDWLLQFGLSFSFAGLFCPLRLLFISLLFNSYVLPCNLTS